MTTQDLVEGTDLTGITNIGATELMQLVRAAYPGDETGMVLYTIDTALDTPDVPNPNVAIGAVTPTKWKRYLWIRVPFAGASGVKVYVWDEGVTSDAVYLKWVLVTADVAQALTDSATALSNSESALLSAQSADLAATSAEAISELAKDTADASKVTADAANAAIADLQTTINLLFPTGCITATIASTSYSTSADEGWLECNGAAVSRTVFSDLFTALGVTWGAGDGATTFNIPDFRGRALIGAGTGAGGLTNRVLGTAYGTESSTLAEANIPLHNHGIADTVGTWRDDGVGTQGHPAGGTGSTVAWADFGQASPTPVPIIQPSGVVRWLIKT